MAAKMSSNEDGINDINITPFVDVMLVLLVMVMLMVPAMYFDSVKVDLPKAATAKNAKKVTLMFSLDAKGNLFLGKKKIALEELPEHINQAKAKDEKADALLSADKSITYARIIEVIDMVRGAGIRKVGLATKPQGN